MGNKFAERLTKARESAGYSKKRLSELLGNIHPSNISNWERGKNEPRIDVIIKISQLLDVSIEYLLGESENVAIAKEPSPPTYGNEDAETKLLQKQLESLVKINERLSAMLEKLQDGKSRSEEENRELQRKYEKTLLQLADVKAGKDID